MGLGKGEEKKPNKRKKKKTPPTQLQTEELAVSDPAHEKGDKFIQKNNPKQAIEFHHHYYGTIFSDRSLAVSSHRHARWPDSNLTLYIN